MITQSEIRKLPPKPSSYKRGCGNGLFVWVTKTYPGTDNKQYGGKKYFKGRYKDSEIQIGVFGTRYGELSLEDAQREWHQIKFWSKQTGNKVSNYKDHQQKKIDQEQKTLEDAVDGFLKDKEPEVKENTFREYERQLQSHVFAVLSKTTPLHELEWDNGGRGTITRVLKEIKIKVNGSGVEQGRRIENALSQVFRFAISQGWMKRGQNPIDEDKEKKKSEKDVDHHPTLPWNEVPTLLKDISLNRSNSHIQMVLSMKMLLMVFLRAGALVRLEWDWIKEVDGIKCFVLPGTTSGLKRKKGINEHIDHHVPITKQMEILLDRLKEHSYGSKYVFQPMRQSRYDHLTPEAPNDYLIRLGYKDRQRAHGWRRTARTHAVDQLGIEKDVIKRQMGHLPDNKVDKAYDQSLRLKDRKELMDRWCDLLVQNGLEL